MTKVPGAALAALGTSDRSRRLAVSSRDGRAPPAPSRSPRGGFIPSTKITTLLTEVGRASVRDHCLRQAHVWASSLRPRRTNDGLPRHRGRRVCGSSRLVRAGRPRRVERPRRRPRSRRGQPAIAEDHRHLRGHLRRRRGHRARLRRRPPLGHPFGHGGRNVGGPPGLLAGPSASPEPIDDRVQRPLASRPGRGQRGHRHSDGRSRSGVGPPRPSKWSPAPPAP